MRLDWSHWLYEMGRLQLQMATSLYYSAAVSSEGQDSNGWEPFYERDMTFRYSILAKYLNLSYVKDPFTIVTTPVFNFLHFYVLRLAPILPNHSTLFTLVEQTCCYLELRASLL